MKTPRTYHPVRLGALFLFLIVLILAAAQSGSATAPAQSEEPPSVPDGEREVDQDTLPGERPPIPAAAPDRREGAPRPPAAVPPAEIALLEALEQALQAEEWEDARRLAAELPPGKYDTSLEQMLAEIPIPRPAPASDRPPVAPADEQAAALAEAEHDAALQAALAEHRARTQNTQDVGGALVPRESAPEATTDVRSVGPVFPPGLEAEVAADAPQATGAILTVGPACTYANLQAAVDAAAPNDTIYVHGTTWTGSTALVSITKSLYIIGGLDSTCTSYVGTQTILDAGAAYGSIIEISGSGTAVDLYYLRLTGGTDAAAGALEILGGYDVRLFDVDIIANSATLGGGVYLSGANTLLVDRGSVIGGNSATQHGGGIYCANGGTVTVESGFVGSSVYGGNVADSNGTTDGYGGGAYLDNCTLYLGATDNTLIAYLYYNEAYYGGGIFATNNGYVGVRHQNAQIENNQSVDRGGGVYLSAGSDLWVDDGDVQRNISGYNGGGIYAYGSSVIADMDTNAGCTHYRCTELSANSATLHGGGAYVGGGARLDLESVYVQNNQASSLGSAVYAVSNNTFVDLDSAMVTDNSAGSAYTLRLYVGDVRVQVDSSTFAGNTHGSAAFGITEDARLDAFGLIVWGNSSTSLVAGSGDATVDCSILAAPFPGSNNLVADPIFLDPANGNYHISRNSPAVDHCNGGFIRDIDYESRPHDVPGVFAIEQTGSEDGSAGALAPGGEVHVVRLFVEDLVGQDLAAALPAGALRAVDYGEWIWLELDDAQFAALQASGLRFEEATEYGTLVVGPYRFDPLSENPLADGADGVAATAAAPRDAAGRALYLLQLERPARDDELSLLENSVRLIQYYPHLAYLVWADEQQVARAQKQSGNLRWVGEYAVAYRQAPAVQRAVDEAATGERLLLRAQLVNDGDLDAVAALVEARGGMVRHLSTRYSMGQPEAIGTLEMALPAGAVADLLRLPNLIHLDPFTEDRLYDESSDQIIADNAPGGVPATGYNAFLNTTGYDGGGVTVAIVDSGADWDHPDLQNISGGISYGVDPESGEPGSDPSNQGHGTHVAGIVGATGAANVFDADGFEYGLGVAPGVSLFTQNAISSPQAARKVRVYDSADNSTALSNNSWGAAPGTGYDGATADYDGYVLDAIDDNGSIQDEYLNVFAAGNDGGSCGSGPCLSSIGNPGEAKNTLVVGSTDSARSTSQDIDAISWFSSRGPALDSRIRPDVVAPGDQIVSTENTDGANDCWQSPAGTTQYAFCSGTSMASPHVAGMAALFTDFWYQRYSTTADPHPALVKAAIINSTDDLAGADDGWGNTIGNRPNAHQGWGRVNLDRLLNPAVAVQYYQNPDLLQGVGETWTVAVRPDDPGAPLRVTLVWMDAPGAANANPALVNDLDLLVTDPNTTYFRGNVFSGGWSIAGGSYDRRNNVENVWIANPVDGTYSVRVRANALGGDADYFNGDNTDQPFSLVCYNCEVLVDGPYDAGADEAYAFVGINGNLCEYGTIAAAIGAAADGDTIYIPQGYYPERLGTVTKDLTLGQATDDCTGRLYGSYSGVTIDANAQYVSWGGVLNIDSSSTVTLSHLYLTDGSAQYGGLIYVTGGSKAVLENVGLGYGTATGFGGAIRNQGLTELRGSTLLFSNSTSGSGQGAGVAISSGTVSAYDSSSIGWSGTLGNDAANDGGGVYLTAGALRLYGNSRVRGNVATANGGGIYAGGTSTVTLYDNARIGETGVGNTAVVGGGAYITGTATLALGDSADMRGNSAGGDGGAIYAGGGSAVLIDGSSTFLQYNEAADYGGGFFVDGPATFTLAQGEVRENSAYLGGGGYLLNAGGTVNLDGGTLNNNSAYLGGGVRTYASGTAGSTLNLSGTAVYSNTATGNGGGLALGGGVFNMSAGSVDDNSADGSGGGIYAVGSIALNLGSSAGPASISHNWADADGNNVGDGGGIYYTGAGDLNVDALADVPFLIQGNSAENGGGLYLNNPAAYFNPTGDVRVLDNVARTRGGGVFQSGGDGYLDDYGGLRPLFADNVATTGDGGGFYLTGVTIPANYFNGVDIHRNRAPGGNGGGIYADGVSTNLRNVHMEGNEAYAHGGAIFATGSALDIFADTVAPAAPQTAAPDATICNPAFLGADDYCSRFANNHAGVGTTGYGGALFLQDSDATVEHTAFLDNGGGLGSAAYLRDATSSLALSNTLLRGNLNTYPLRLADGSLAVADSTIAGSPGTAVGIYSAVSLTFDNTILWDNGGGIFTNGVTVNGACNISQDGNLPGITADPLFVTTARGSYRLNAGSPAVDACNSGTTTGDLDNVARPKDGDATVSAAEYDMGAFEFVCTSGLPATTVGIAVAGGGSDVHLSWTPGATNDFFTVHRDTAPYFTAGAGTWVFDGLKDSTGWTDPGAAGDPLANHYYYVYTTNCDGSQPQQVEHLGEFDFSLVPGS